MNFRSFLTLAVFAAGCRATVATGPGSPPPPAPPPPVVRDHREPPPPPPPPPHENPPPPHQTAPVWNSAGWTLLGSADVNGRVDHDTITVGKQEGHFDQIMMVVTNGDLDLQGVKFTFVSGQSFKPQVKQMFREGQRTRAIDLPRENRLIQKIDVDYAKIPGEGRPHVEFWARDVK